MNPHISFILFLADTNLVLAQRNSEWCAHGPILEQDIAITNISLDLLGQARNFYQLAATLLNENNAGITPATEDSLAYHRTEREFLNLLISELPNEDWGLTVLRQFLVSTYERLLYTSLRNSADAELAAIAEKSLKEVTYHIKWSSEWVIRLGDGTEESHQRMHNAINRLWMYTGEMFEPAEFEKLEGLDFELMKVEWEKQVLAVFEEANLGFPATAFMQSGGKTGQHTEHLGFLLAEMQYLQRAYPGAEW